MDGSSFFKSSPPGSDEFNKMARPNCSECGSKKIRWMSTSQLLATVPEDGKARAREGMAFSGDGARAWFCDKCGGWGVFGDFEQG